MDINKVLKHYIQGFSLIEVLIVLGIISILSSYAYPNYQTYLLRAHRTEAQTALVMLASQMEFYYSENRTYAEATIEKINGSNQSQNGYYLLSIENLSPETYELLATPQGNQIKDSLCQTLSFDQLGNKNIQKGPSGYPTGTAKDCWE